MKKEHLSVEQKILLTLLERNLNGEMESIIDAQTLKTADWAKIAKESVVQAVALIAYDSATAYKEYIPQEICEKWKNVAMSVASGNYRALQAQVDLINLLRDKKLNHLILKGTSASAYYPKPELRALGDVDFLVSLEQQEKVEKALEDAGYSRRGDDHTNHVVFEKPHAHLEMHFEVAGVPYGWRGERVREFLSGAVDSGQQKNLDISTFNAPSDINHALILLLHMQHHMLGEGLGLRHLCDWAVFVKSTFSQPFWEQTLLPFLKEIGLFVYASAMTKTCAKYLKTPCPEWAFSADDETCDQIIEDVFLSGNFGGKDFNRAKSAMLISEHGKAGTKHGKLYNLSHALHKAVLLQYPIVKKIWILYPVLYVYKALRFLFLSMIGKRPSLVKMAPEAKKRKAIYEKLKVFENKTEEK